MTDTPIDQLVSLVAGEITGEQAREVLERLASSEQGRAELEQLRGLIAFLRDEPSTSPPESIVARAKRELARSKPGLIDRISGGCRSFVAALDLDTRFTPAAAGFRGTAEVAQVAFSAEPCELDLELQPLDDGLTELRGQIDADDPSGWSLALIDASGDTVAEIAAAEDGRFRVELGHGTYTIVLTRGDVRVEAGPLPLP